MMKEHEKLLQLINNKINCLKEDQSLDDKEKIDRFSKLYSLISNEYSKFFSKITIEVAISILNDIGIEENPINMYSKLVKEELEGYKLIDDEILKK